MGGWVGGLAYQFVVAEGGFEELAVGVEDLVWWVVGWVGGWVV